MKQCLIDTGPLVALFDRSDKYHQKTIGFIENFNGQLVTSLATITETIYLLDFSQQAQHAFLTWVAEGALTIQEIDANDGEYIVNKFQKYSDLPMDFADGCLLAISEKLGVCNIATIDSDFDIYRVQRNKKLNIHIGEF